MNARGIVQAYESLPCSTRDAGRKWYNLARGQALRIACEANIGPDVACGVIARLSPGVRWDQNLAYARELCMQGELIEYSGYPANVDRARALLDSGVWTPAPRGPKVNAFQANLFDPSDGEPVTLDRHMLRFMAWPGAPDRGPWPREYERLTEPWRNAAGMLGLVTCQVQAALWLAVRDEEVPF